MKLETAPYNSAESTHAALVEEPAFLSYTIDHNFNNPAIATIVLADPTGLLAQKYAVYNGAVGGAVADDGGAETDETAAANEDTADDITLLPAAPALEDAYYFGFSRPFSAVQLNISTVANTVGLYVITWEYSTGADAWSALSDVTDGTVKYTTAGVSTIDWTVPDDWATDTVGAIADLYWVRGRLSDNAAWVVVPLAKQAWIEGVYVGPGRAKIEDPTGTCIFEGRILKARHEMGAGRVTLLCQDWLSQLDEDRINYDIREDLDGSGLKESYAHGDANNATYVGAAYNDGAGNYYFYDDNMDWVADEHNNDYLIFTAGMAGKNTWTFYPYDSTAAGDDIYNDDPENVWTDDELEDTGLANNDWSLLYQFRTFLGHNTPSNFYVHDSITGARVNVVHQVDEVPSTNHAHLEIYENDGPGWVELEHIEEQDVFHRDKLEVNIDWLPHIVHNTGVVDVRFNLDRFAGNVTHRCRFLTLELDVETTGYSTAISITDTLDLNAHGGKVNCLKVGTDLTAAATRIWQGIPYSIVKKIKDKVGAIITDNDPLFTLDSSIEATDGVTTRNYQERTALEILKDLADVDKTVFWIPLSDHTTPTVTWKRTFNAGAPTAITDASVLSWSSGEYDYLPMTNEYHVYGVRISDNQLYVDTGALAVDPGVDSKATFGTTRSASIKNTGTISEYECEELGKALVERDEDVHLFLRAEIAGLSTLRLGSEVSITSTFLGLAAAKYVVTHWSYDSNVSRTHIRLHPRQSIGFIKHLMFGEHIRHVVDEAKLAAVDKNIPSLSTQEW